MWENGTALNIKRYNCGHLCPLRFQRNIFRNWIYCLRN